MKKSLKKFLIEFFAGSEAIHGKNLRALNKTSEFFNEYLMEVLYKFLKEFMEEQFLRKLLKSHIREFLKEMVEVIRGRFP